MKRSVFCSCSKGQSKFENCFVIAGFQSFLLDVQDKVIQYIWTVEKSTRLMWSLQLSTPFQHWWERTWKIQVFSCCCLNKVDNCNNHVNPELLLCLLTRLVNFKLMKSCPSRCIIHTTLAIARCKGFLTFILRMSICNNLLAAILCRIFLS